MITSPVVTTSAGELVPSSPGDRPRRLIMLRHGETSYNATKRMQGQLDTELSEVGRAQAAAVAKYFSVAEPNLTRIISSDLSRAADTAAAVSAATGVAVVHDQRLRETNLGIWQAMRYDEIDRDYPGMRDRWQHVGDWAPEGGETRKSVALRVRGVIDELYDDTSWPGNTFMLVAHGGAIAAATASLLGVPDTHFTMFNGLRNTAWIELEARVRDTGELRWYLVASNAEANRMARYTENEAGV